MKEHGQRPSRVDSRGGASNPLRDHLTQPTFLGWGKRAQGLLKGTQRVTLKWALELRSPVAEICSFSYQTFGHLFTLTAPSFTLWENNFSYSQTTRTSHWWFQQSQFGSERTKPKALTRRTGKKYSFTMDCNWKDGNSEVCLKQTSHYERKASLRRRHMWMKYQEMERDRQIDAKPWWHGVPESSWAWS